MTAPRLVVTRWNQGGASDHFEVQLEDKHGMVQEVASIFPDLPEAEASAYAHHFAAAPEMLQALHRVLAWSGSFADRRQVLPLDIAEDVRAAINAAQNGGPL